MKRQKNTQVNDNPTSTDEARERHLELSNLKGLFGAF